MMSIAQGLSAILTAASAIALSVVAQAQPAESDSTALARYRTAEKIGQERLKTADALDFDVFSHQAWDRLGESHTADILVHYPDGHTTRGLPDHIAEMNRLFAFAPDTHISSHPMSSASGEWTTVIGIMEGTFSKPIPLPDGKSIPATGRSFRLAMATVAHWQGGLMDEEYVFYDNDAFMKEIGLRQ